MTQPRSSSDRDSRPTVSEINIRPFEGISVLGRELPFGAAKEVADQFRIDFDLSLEYDDQGRVNMMMLDHYQHTPVLNSHRIEARTMREAAAGLVTLGFQASLKPLNIRGVDLVAPYEYLTTFAELEAAYQEWEAVYCPDTIYFDAIGLLLWSDLATDDNDTDYYEPVLNTVGIWRRDFWDNPAVPNLFKGKLELT